MTTLTLISNEKNLNFNNPNNVTRNKYLKLKGPHLNVLKCTCYFFSVTLNEDDATPQFVFSSKKDNKTGHP